MRNIEIFKARQSGDDTIQNVSIILDDTLPEFESLERSSKLFSNDAQKLEKILHETLPGGTYDRLLQKMLDRKSSQFVVPFGKKDKL